MDMKDGYVNGIFKFSIPEKDDSKKTISYSQFSQWASCPKMWKLNYADGLRERTDSIHTVFGTAFHETLQHYLTVMYTQSVKAADNINVYDYLRDQMASAYISAMESSGGVVFTDKKEMEEFYEDGCAILDWFKRKRGAYFSRKGYELVAIEMPIYRQASDINDNIYMNGFVDVIIKDTVSNKLIVYDIKTSTRGWNKYQKADKLKQAQLVLYKKYLSEQLNVPLEKIDIKFFIVKRKLLDGFMYPQKRVQEFVPPSGKPTINKLMLQINEFIRTGFNADGSYNLESNYPPIAGKNSKHCKYCPFKDREDLCPKKERIKE